MNSTLAVFAEALAVTTSVPEEVVPAIGEVMEMVGGVGVVFLTLVLVTTAQPTQSTVDTNSRLNHGNALDCESNVECSLMGDLIAFSLAFSKWPVSPQMARTARRFPRVMRLILTWKLHY